MILPSITKKQQAIILLLYKFRFLNRIQIQTLLGHKQFNGINVWLKDLTAKEYTGKKVDTSSKIHITPTTYFLELNGIGFMKKQPSCEPRYLKKLYKEESRSEEFINRCLFIADMYIDLWQTYKNTSSFTFYTPSDYSLDGIIREISPHCVFRKEEGKPYYVIELFSDTIPRFAIRKRVTQYIRFFTKGDWVKNEQLPNILFICPDSKIENYIYRFAQKVLKEESITDLAVYLSTKEQVTQHGIEGETWQQVEVE